MSGVTGELYVMKMIRRHELHLKMHTMTKRSTSGPPGEVIVMCLEFLARRTAPGSQSLFTNLLQKG